MANDCCWNSGVHKSHTTAYYLEGDGMVEQFNRYLLQLLCNYIDNVANCEWSLPLVLYVYRTFAYSSTGVSPYMLMFWRQPHTVSFNTWSWFDSASYQGQDGETTRSKLGLALPNKSSYDNKSNQCSFKVNDPVCLSVLTAGTDLKWKGNWKMMALKGPSYECWNHGWILKEGCPQ